MESIDETSNSKDRQDLAVDRISVDGHRSDLADDREAVDLRSRLKKKIVYVYIAFSVIALLFVLLAIIVAVIRFTGNVINKGNVEIDVSYSGGEKKTSDGTIEPLMVKGRVFWSGILEDRIEVSLLEGDEFNNRYWLGSATTDKRGEFQIGSINMKSSGNNLIVSVRAPGKDVLGIPVSFLTTERQLVFGKPVSQRLKETEGWLWIITILFCIGLFLGLSRPYNKIRMLSSYSFIYYLLVICTLLLSIIMPVYFSKVLSIIDTGGKPRGDSLGFAAVFKGTYVKGVPPEWLFSLTSSTLEGSDKPDEVTQGFGAPLWVLLLSVIGTTLYTLHITVNEVSDLPDFTRTVDNDQLVRKRLAAMVQHLVAILFSPFGGILIYQLLVVVGAASRPFAVAITALGVGVSWNTILIGAIESAQNLLTRKEAIPTRNDSPTRPTTEKHVGSVVPPKQAGTAVPVDMPHQTQTL